MKKSLLFIFSIMAYIGYAQCTDPVITDFECSQPSHPITGALVTVPNTVSGGINTSPNIGEYTDNGNDGFDALVVDYGAPIDLSTNNQLKVKFYSTTSVQILAKLEGGSNPEIFSDFSAVNTWQEFTFDFSAFAGQGNNKVVLFFNPNVITGTADVYYIDDFLFDSLATPPCEQPVITNFECSAPSNTIIGALVNIPNPVSGGINTSANVGQYTDDGTAGFDALVVDYGMPIDLSSNNILKLKFYSPTSVQILAKLEGGSNPEIYSDFSAVNTWEEFTFDFSAFAGQGNTKVVLFVNPTVTSGTPSDIYYIDDLLFDTTLSLNNVSLNNNTVKVYPNPAREILNIFSSENIENYKIFDILGKNVASTSTEMISNEISISHLKDGIYFIRLNTATSSSVIKFIKK
ncbi:T9SS type A sorting domain-containing protein [Psychroserpens sp. Hel_I_66]|uniref:T9SS type A sorting domain-containing protein n=1 Tax=Psychroserpens sp. Hel_I_66 TaxID=1250004 RepID=UPI000647648C|nr:T9SS type A sorting domain-containing protein [Psychroserpens sp. Hel_I_66]